MSEFLPFEDDELVLAASRCLDRRGLRDVRVEEIAELAGCSVEVVRQRFPTPVDAATAVMQAVVSGMAQALADDTDEQSPLSERLMTLVLYEMQVLNEYRGLVEDVMFTAVDPTAWGLAVDLASTQTAPISRYVGLVENQIALARTRGEVSWWVNPKLASAAFWVLHVRIITAWLNSAERDNAQLLGQVHKWILGFCRGLGESKGRLGDAFPAP